MLARPISMNGNLCKEFNMCSKEEISVIAGGYIITPRGEIIEVRDNDEHCKIFSSYINSYLEKEENVIYDTLTATKILCKLGCCVYAGIRLEYIKNKLEKLENCLGSLTFPSSMETMPSIQKDICLYLMETNQSLFGNKEKIMIQYGSFPDNIYTKEQVLNILTKSSIQEADSKIIDLNTLKLEPIDYNRKEHLSFLKNLMQSKDIGYLWNLADSSLTNNQNTDKYIILNETLEKIGYVNYSNPTEAIYGNTVSLYYAIDEKYRGQEYGKKIIEEITDWLFQTQGIDCIIAQADVDNIHSINTLMKAGMTKINEDDEYTTFMQRKSR